eukprot:Phypoly_transcript_02894.p1 GENE.Phypoly_transcript_02894~~Phypoly_transcript_02894.p1  ORF type:complete len:746 (+),score=98.98 Phypoly_transcript_02894:338-2575(+)
MMLPQSDLNIIRANNERFVENVVNGKLLDVGDVTIQVEVDVKSVIFNQWMKDMETYLVNAKGMDETLIVMDKMRIAHGKLFSDTVSRKKLYDKVDADSALSVLENDILTDSKPATKVEGAAIIEQPESMIQDIGEIGKWAKKKKPTWEAVKTFFPIVNWMKDYKKEYLLSDISVGLSSGTMIIPQAMAYAFLAGMPPIYGLYCAFVPTLMYVIFGSSRHLAIGPLAIVSILVGAAVNDLNPKTTEEYIGLANLLALLVGINFLLMSILRLGFLINFLSRPVLSGFTSAAAILIICSQLHYFFGVKVPNDKYAWAYIYHTFQKLGDTVVWEPVMGLVCLLVLYVLKNYVKVIPKTKIPVPSPLILVIVGLILSYTLDFESHKISVVGHIPSGLPHPNFFTSFSLDDALDLYGDSLIIPIVGLIETISAAKAAATKHKYDLDMKQELFALGVANIAGTIFGAYPSMGAFGRTALHMNSGAFTQVCSLVSVFVVVITLLLLTGVFYYLPKVILASIVTFAVASLVDFEEVQKLYRFNKLDALLLLVTLLATFILGVQPGILTAVCLSLIVVLFQTSRPSAYFMGRMPGTTAYTDVRLESEAITTPGIMAFRFDAPLIFANAAYFRAKVYDCMERQENEGKVHTIVFDFASVSYVDSTGIKYLKEILRELNIKQVVSLYADVRPKVLSIFKKSGFFLDVGEDHFFLRVHDAMKEAVTGQVTIATIQNESAGIQWNCFRTKDTVDYNQLL